MEEINQERPELRETSNIYNFVGKIYIPKDSYTEEKSGKNNPNYLYHSINFGIDTGEGNRVFFNVMGGYIRDLVNNKNKVWVSLKDKATGGRTFQSIDHDILNDQEFVKENVICPMNTNMVISKKIINKETREEEIIEEVVERGLPCEYDIVSYLKDNLKNGMEVKISARMKVNNYNGNVSFKYNPIGIYLPDYKEDKDNDITDTINARAVGTQTVFVTSNSLDEFKDEMNDSSTDKVHVNAFVLEKIKTDMKNEEGKNIYKNTGHLYPLTIYKENERTLKIAELIFNVEDEEEVKALNVNIEISQGKVSLASSDDIEDIVDETLQELIKLGLTTLDEVQSNATITGNKEYETIFKMPRMIVKDGKTKIDCQTGFTREDLFQEIDKLPQGEDTVSQEDLNTINDDVDAVLKEMGMI